MNKVLVIDDYEANLKLYGKVISRIPQTEVVPFTVSKQALVWCDANDPALVVVDQNMPDPDGLEFIRLYRQLRGRAETPIIMITGTQDRELRREALRRGASAFLNKPVDPVEFLSYATNFIVSRSSRMDAITRAEGLLLKAQALGSQLEERDRLTIDHLGRTLTARDRRLGEHGLCVAGYAEKIARHAGLSVMESATIAIAARVHDIGKLALPDRIFLKTGKLNTEERELAQSHARAGAEILGSDEGRLIAAAAELALTHHEAVDGSGYPSGLRGDAIPIGGRVVAIADAFAALTSIRPWRDAMTVGHAVEEIERAAGTRFDTRLVGAFRDAMPEIIVVRALYPDLTPR